MNAKYIATIAVILFVALGVFMLFSNQNTEEAKRHVDGAIEAYEIHPEDVARKIENGEDIILLDVRTPEEYGEVHLENSLLLPVGELTAKTLVDIGLGENTKDKEIIIYCRSGGRSKQAYDIMYALGYTNIKSIAGGMIHWQEDNYPFTESGAYDGAVYENAVQNTDTNGPRVSFDRTLHDFGESPKSKGVIQTTFTVTNTGSGVLQIGEISTSCGCTTAEISKANIPAGGRATLTVHFDPDFHPEPAGKITRTVFIPTNDPQNIEAEVRIAVSILEDK
jgi:rhodanese-related sulfurtransferase